MFGSDCLARYRKLMQPAIELEVEVEVELENK